MKKQRRLTDKEQRVASDILVDYIIAHMNDHYDSEFVERIMKRYELFDDPFTHLPCTAKEYAGNSLEYHRQTMIQRYGHCDGLD